jgi:probable O-glycosylation ligase (exosortase A-associated)
VRDIALVLIVFGSVPFILRRPFIGVIEWTWLAYFNPHKMMFGFAQHLPFSQIVGGVTILAWLINAKEPKRLPLSATTIIWILFVFWMVLTTSFALDNNEALIQLNRVLKVQIFAIFTVVALSSLERVRALVWCIVLSIGYYAFKGGVWVLLTGGSSGRVWGPEGTFIEGNNELALATLMVIPLAYYLYTAESARWRQRLILIGMGLAGFSVAGSFSRGAALAAVAMSLFLVWGSRKKFVVGVGVVVVGVAVYSVMPQSWTDRLNTIHTYEQDDSAMKRINAWQFAWNYTSAHPVFGGGMGVFSSREAYQTYAPRFDEGWIGQDAHSNYLKILGEHGFPGLLLFLGLIVAAWVQASRVVRRAVTATAGSVAIEMATLARMCQASIVAYMVGGAFLGLCYFDLPYNIIGLCAVLATGAVGGSVGRETSGSRR